MASKSLPYFNFSAGLNTEATPLNYPENTMLDSENVVIERDGSLRKRLGIDYESSYSELTATAPVDLDVTAISMHLWENPGGNSNKRFLVVQIGNRLHFFDANAQVLSDNELSFTNIIGVPLTYISLTPYEVNPVESGKYKIATASGKGNLYVVAPNMEPIYLSYYDSYTNPSTGNTYTEVLDTTIIDVQVRDFEDVEPEVANDYNPPVLTQAHNYMLRNAGWPWEALRCDKINVDPVASVGTSTSPILSGYGYPSKADIYSACQSQFTQGGVAVPCFWPDILKTKYFGNTPAPRGHFLYSAWDINRNEAMNDNPYGYVFSTIQTNTESTRPSTVEFYAGRAWYSGLSTGENIGKLYFSKIIEYGEDAGKCYQEADPTSQEISDLVATDGGVIDIQGSGQVLRLVSAGASLIVFAQKGVWEIRGVESSFDATGYVINKVTSAGAFSANSVIKVENTIFYWSAGGIYVLTQDEILTGFKANNISLTTIQSLYNSIDNTAKVNARGVYDEQDKKVYWFYNSGEDIGTGEFNQYHFNTVLVFSITTSAFYPLSISHPGHTYPWVADVAFTQDINSEELVYFITHNGDQVQADGEDVVVTSNVDYVNTVKLKMLTIIPDVSTTIWTYTFSEFLNTNYLDWVIFDDTGTGYDAYFDTGYQTLDDASRYKQTPYVITLFKRTELSSEELPGGGVELDNPSSCLLSAKWDWSDTSTSGKFSTPRQAYRYTRNFVLTSGPFDYGFDIISTKNKLRGRGRSLRLRFEGEEGKNFHLYGWQVYYTGTQNV